MIDAGAYSLGFVQTRAAFTDWLQLALGRVLNIGVSAGKFATHHCLARYFMQGLRFKDELTLRKAQKSPDCTYHR
eukprot:6186885-Pleurochrysis_carterae.AAC.5